jgi:hypothetical protein
MIAPLRQIVEWKTVANPDPAMRAGLFPKAYIGLLDCGHTVNFGGGARPSLTQVRCAECVPVEPEVA